MGHLTETHAVTAEWVKRAFTELATKLKAYQNNYTQWMAAATKQMVDNADRCTALETRATDIETKETSLETKVSELETRATDIETKEASLETKVSELESKMAELYTVISETDAVSIVDDNWDAATTTSEEA